MAKTKKKLLPHQKMKWKTIREIKDHFEKQLAPIKKERAAAIKSLKTECRHPKKYQKRERHGTKSECFYDGYQPPGEPSYIYGHYFTTTCEACGKKLGTSATVTDYER